MWSEVSCKAPFLCPSWSVAPESIVWKEVSLRWYCTEGCQLCKQAMSLSPQLSPAAGVTSCCRVGGLWRCCGLQSGLLQGWGEAGGHRGRGLGSSWEGTQGLVCHAQLSIHWNFYLNWKKKRLKKKKQNKTKGDFFVRFSNFLRKSNVNFTIYMVKFCKARRHGLLRKLGVD